MNLKEAPIIKGYEYGDLKAIYGSQRGYIYYLNGITVIGKENKSYKCEISVVNKDPSITPVASIEYLNCV